MAYIGNSPENIQRGRRAIYEFTSTAGQTVYTGLDDNNQTLDLLEANEQSVFLNGIRLVPTDDYTVSGDTLTLTSAASLNDHMIIETQTEVGNAVTYTRAESDARYINYDGDIVAGDLQISGEVDTGSLIVDTDVLVVDATNNRVGIGTATPSTTASGYDGGTLHIHNAGTGSSIRLTNSTTGTGTSDGMLISKWSDSKTYFTNFDNDADTIFTQSNSGGSLVTTLVLKGDGKVGIGTSSPNNLLTLNSNTANTAMTLQSSDSGGAAVVFGDQSDFSRGRIIYNNSDDSMSFETNNLSEAMRIDSSGNVGIGTSSPSQKLDVNGSVNIPNDYSYGFGGAGSNTYISGNNASNNLRFNTNGSERMRIDSSGNLLVGKTTNGSTVTGCELREEGFVIASMDGDHAAVFDRKTSDGVIVQLRKDNSTVGLIASNGGAISIGSDDVGVYFDAGSDRILPMNASTNAVRNDAIDLGGNPHRFKDLYLSGGVYLGGTGSANKLDDYEEGTWTPTISSGTFTAENAWYVKVGTLITISAKLSGFSDTSSGNSVTVGGVPFTTKASDHTAQGSMIADYLSNGPYFPYISSNATTIRFYIQSTTTYTTMLHSNLGSSGSFYFTLTYQTQ